MNLRSLIGLLALTLTAVACGSKSPAAPSTTPTPTPTTTRIIRLEGSMNFGSVTLSSTKTNKLTVYNDGNSTLTFTGLTATSGLGAVITATPNNATVGAGQHLDVVIAFTPTSLTTYSGTISVTSDATSGTGSIAFSGTGSLDGIPVFTKSGSGDSVFDLPTYVSRIRITGRYTASSSNFIVKISGKLIVNELLGTFWGQTQYDGTLLTGGGTVVQITDSSGVQWSFTEVR